MKKLTDLIKELEDTRLYQEEKIKAQIAHDILKTIQDLGMQQSDLAAAMEVKPSYVSRVVSATENLSLRSLVKIASALNKELLVSFQSKEEKTISNDFKERLLDSLARSSGRRTAYDIGIGDMDWSNSAANNESFHVMDFSKAEAAGA